MGVLLKATEGALTKGVEKLWSKVDVVISDDCDETAKETEPRDKPSITGLKAGEVKVGTALSQCPGYQHSDQ